MARARRQRPAALFQEALDDAVLEAVEGDDRQPAAGAKHALGGAQALLELVELGVQMDADRLEGAGGGVALLALAETQRLSNDGGEFGGARQRPGGDDGAGDRAGARFLAIVLEDAGDLGLVGGIEKLGGRLAGLAHPHVERAVVGKGKTALGAVELHRRHADVEGDSVDRRQPALGERPVHPAEALVDQGQARVRDERCTLRDRRGVAIEGDHSSRPRPKQGLGVAAGAERTVDLSGAGLHGEAGDDLIEQHRLMRRPGNGGRAHGFIPRSSSRKRAMSFKSSGTRLSARNSFGFQIWKVSPAPRNSASSPISPLRRIIGGRTMRPELS